MNGKRRYQFIFLAYFVANNGLISFRNAYFEQIGLTGSQMGLLGALLVVGALVAQPVWGILADKYDATKRLLLFGIVVAGLGGLLFPLSEHVTWSLQLLIVATLTVSIFRAPIVPVATSMVMSEGIEYGHVRAVGSLAFGFGSLLLGWIVTFAGLTSIFFVFTLGMGLVFVAVLGVEDPNADISPDLRRDALSLLSNPQFVLLLGVGIIVGGITSAEGAFLPVYLRELVGSDQVTGIAWLVKTIGEASAFVAVTALGFDDRSVLSLGIVGFVIAYATLAVAPATPVAVAVLFVSGGGLAMFLLSAVRMTHRFAPDTLAATAQTLLSAIGMGIGRAGGQLIAGYLFGIAGVFALYQYLAGAAVIALAVSLIFHARRLPSIRSG